MPTALDPEVQHRLDTGSLLVLPTARAAAELRRHFDTQQRQAQLPSWELANVQSWQQWTQSLWTSLVLNGAETRLLLNAAQEQSLWEEIIRADQTRDGLGSSTALATLARAGFQRAAAFNATGRLRASATTEDSRIFSEWAESFTASCKKLNCLSPALLESALTRAVETGTLAPPPTLAFVACNNLTPAQHTLLDALGAAGTDILHLPLAAASPATQPTVTILETQTDELTHAAHWLRSQLDHARTIALLVPGLASEHTQIERTLRDTLAPELHNIAEDLSSTPWHISTGPALTTLPLIADALDLLRLSTAALPIDRISALLLSPHLGLTTNRDASARFDAQTLRRTHLLRPELDLTTLLRLSNPPQWLQNLHTELQRAGDLTRPRSYTAWTELFRNLTHAANWPGDRGPTASEFALLDAWESALDTISTLDFTAPRVAFADTFLALIQQLEATPTPSPTTNAQIKVLTPAEAEGILFDAIVYLRATDANLPARPSVHPLLSWPLQRSLAMPGTDPALDTARALRDLDALLAHTATALFTSAQQDDAGQLRPSPLLSHLSLTTPLAPAATQPLLQLETLPDTTPLPALPTTIYGGTRVLKLQAACGYQAFAELRLRAAELDAPTLGLDALEAGDITHQTLHLLWDELRSQQALLALTPDARRALVLRHLDTALARHPAYGTWDTAYLAMHRRRTLDLLLRWLDREAERTPFTDVRTEVDQIIQIGPLHLKVRIDRIDTVTLNDTPGTLLIDYKTGSTGSPADWATNRPDDPQLPLYALHTHDPKVAALAFAKVRAGDNMTFLGLQDDPAILPLSKNSVTDIDTEISNWYETLTILANDFASGRATVSPKSFPGTCKHCGQRLLCRVEPATQAEIAEEASEDADV